MELIETLEKVLGFELGGFSLGSLLSAALQVLTPRER